MIRVVFLDFDGVLKKHSGPWWPEAIRHLDRIIDATGAQIVVSSTWRIGRTVNDLRLLLSAKGLNHWLFVNDKTPDLLDREGDTITNFRNGEKVTLYRARPRRHEIGAWLIAHPDVTRYAIIDDDEDAGPDHFVLTDSDVGLTRRHADTAIKILNRMDQI